jgi:hypothetical protein
MRESLIQAHFPSIRTGHGSTSLLSFPFPNGIIDPWNGLPCAWRHEPVMKCLVPLRWTIKGALAAAVLLLSGPAFAESRVALVIGNNLYKNLPADDQLAKAVNDANAVGDMLAKLGFTVTRGINLERAAMVDTIFHFTQSVKQGDTAVVYYAGHGVAINGANYLLPADIPDADAGEEQRVARAAVAEVDVINDVQSSNPRLLLLVMDACRNNPFRRAGTRGLGSSRGLARLDIDNGGLFAIYSASVGQEALDGLGPTDSNPNSVFTRVFIDELAKTDKTLNEVAVATRTQVVRLAKAEMNHDQRPGYYDQMGTDPPYLIPHAAPAASGPDEALWTAIRGTKDAELLRNFISQYPSSARLEEAKAALASLAAPPPPPSPAPVATGPSDEQVWNMVKTAKDPGLIRDFLLRHPDSPYKAEALKVLAALSPPNTPTRPQPSVAPARPQPPPIVRQRTVKPKPKPSPAPAASAQTQPSRSTKPRSGNCFSFNGQTYCE